MMLEDIKLYSPLPRCYNKLYLVVEVTVLLALASTMIFSYLKCLGYFKLMQDDFLIKENVVNALDTLLEQSHTASHYVFSQADSILMSQVST